MTVIEIVVIHAPVQRDIEIFEGRMTFDSIDFNLIRAIDAAECKSSLSKYEEET